MALTIAELQVVIDANLKPLMDAERLALLNTKKLEQALSKAASNIKGAFSGSDTEIKKQALELDTLQRKYDPVFAAQEKYKKKIADIKRLLDAGRITQKAAANAVKSATTAFTQATSASQAYGNSMRNVAASAVAGSNAIKLNNQQLMNMQFQMNDIGVMLASGQSPFVLFMQQGMQISQMFKPGAPFQSVLKAIGSGFMTFVTNPLNLAVLGFASAAGAAKLLWDAMSSSNAKTAEETLSDFDDLIGEVEKSFADAAKEAKEFYDQGESLDVLRAKMQDTASVLKVELNSELEKLNRNILGIVGSWEYWADVTEVLNEGQQRVKDLGLALEQGDIGAKEFRESMAEIALDSSLPEDTREVARELMRASEDASEFEARVNAANEAYRQLAAAPDINKTMTIAAYTVMGDTRTEAADLARTMEFAARAHDIRMASISATTAAEQEAIAVRRKALELDKDGIAGALRAQLLEQARAEARLRAETQLARSRASGMSARNEELAQRAQYLSDLQREVDILSMRSDLQADATKQFEREKELRAAIVDLGPNATAGEIDLVKELIPLRQRLTDELEKQLALQQAQEKLYGELGGVAGSALKDVISGAKSAEEALLRMVIQMAAAILKAQVLSTVQGQGANGQFFNSLIGGILSGVRANGGPVSGGRSYLVGERGPEIFTPSSGGMVIPNNKIRSYGASNDNSVINISVDARGAQKGVGAEIAAALKDYDRNKLPGRIKQIGRNKHAVG